MASLQFLGAAGTVTGSSFLITSGKTRLLVDCGLFQGQKITEDLNHLPLGINPHDLPAVVITHAHLDHVGRLPILVRAGYRGRIFMTEATKVLSELTLMDAAKVFREHSDQAVLYDMKDVEQLLSQIETVNYHQKIKLGEMRFEFYDAGHILGSASVLINFMVNGKTRQIAFSGDLGNTPEDLVKPTEYLPVADLVVMESTYGDRTHSQENSDQVLMEEINAIEASGGTLLIPAFAVERTQEILHRIDHLKKIAKVRESLLVFLDSPMAVKATMIYKQFRELYGAELTSHARLGDPFSFSHLMMVEAAHDSRRIAQYPGAKVIIAGSGMMTGGRILHHAGLYLSHPQTHILFVGFQAEETLGRQILEGAREVLIDHRMVNVAARVRKSSGLSAHADQPKLVNWLSQISSVKNVYLVHGENIARQIFKDKLHEKLAIKSIYLPNLGETVSVS